MFTNQAFPIKEDWNCMELMHPWTLELDNLTASLEVKDL